MMRRPATLACSGTHLMYDGAVFIVGARLPRHGLQVSLFVPLTRRGLEHFFYCLEDKKSDSSLTVSRRQTVSLKRMRLNEFGLGLLQIVVPHPAAECPTL